MKLWNEYVVRSTSYRTASSINSRVTKYEFHFYTHIDVCLGPMRYCNEEKKIEIRRFFSGSKLTTRNHPTKIAINDNRQCLAQISGHAIDRVLIFRVKTYAAVVAGQKVESPGAFRSTRRRYCSTDARVHTETPTATGGRTFGKRTTAAVPYTRVPSRAEDVRARGDRR